MLPKSLNDLFEAASPSKQKPKTARTSTDGEKVDNHAIGLSGNDRAFLKNCFTAVTVSMQEQMAPLVKAQSETSAKVAHLESENEQLRKRLQVLEQAVENGLAPSNEEKLKKLEEKIEARLQELLESSSRNSSQNSSIDEPLFVMGSLGRNVLAKDAEALCRDILKRANIPETQILDLYSPFAFTSNVTIRFPDDAKGHAARREIRKVAHKVDGQDYVVWLDKKKTKAELQPGRMMKALERIVRERMQTAGMDASLVIKCSGSRRIYYQFHANLVGHLGRFDNEWKWGSFGMETFSEAQRNAIITSAMGEIGA